MPLAAPGSRLVAFVARIGNRLARLKRLDATEFRYSANWRSLIPLVGIRQAFLSRMPTFESSTFSALILKSWRDSGTHRRTHTMQRASHASKRKIYFCAPHDTPLASVPLAALAPPRPPASPDPLLSSPPTDDNIRIRIRQIRTRLMPCTNAHAMSV